MNHITFPNVAAIILIIFVALGAGTSFYNDYVKEDRYQLLRSAVIRDCQKLQARSILQQQFANEAGKARRRNAENAAAVGDKVTAENELATARVYEKIAQGFENLTPVDCEESYPK